VAEVQYLGFGPINVAPGSGVQISPGTQAVATGNVVGQVATIAPSEVVIGASGLPAQTTVNQLGTVLPAAPVSVAPQQSAPVLGPMASIAPFTNGPTLAFAPGFVQQILGALGNQSEQAALPGVTPGVLTPLVVQPRDQATLRRGLRITFTSESNVNDALKGQSFDVIDYAESVAAAGGAVRDILQIGTTMPAVNGTRDSFLLQGRQLARNTPSLEIVLA
jgi:hypothetical protein